jgi:transglutaminase/protease-like cytokinesis protein 3
MRICPAQRTKSAEDIAKYIKSKFGSENDRLRAAYSWVAQHISYDISNMYEGIKYRHESEVVKRVLRNRKTVCFGYVVTFKAIAENLGVKIIIVKGYTKQNGRIDAIPHAWCAVKYNDKWRLIDPTWSSGYLSSGVFHKRFNDKWYLVQPEVIIKSHIPFDPVWQFSYFPLNGSEFAAGTKADSITSRFFSYPDTVKTIEQLSEKERLIAENRRVIAMGDSNNMAAKYIETNKASIELIVHNEHVNVFNEAVKLYNAATSLYNKNNLKSAKPKLEAAAEMINSIQNPDREMSASIKDLKKMINSLKSQIEKGS